MRPGEKLNEVLSTPDETIHGTSHPYINRLIPIRAPADVFAAELEQLESATLRRDKDTVRILLFTAGLASGMVPKIPGMTAARVATAGQAPGETFEWPELAEAEAELELHGAATNYLGRPVSDIDQVRT